MSASVKLPLHHKVQKFSSGTGSPRWSWKKGHKTVVVVVLRKYFIHMICFNFFTFSAVPLLDKIK